MASLIRIICFTKGIWYIMNKLWALGLQFLVLRKPRHNTILIQKAPEIGNWRWKKSGRKFANPKNTLVFWTGQTREYLMLTASINLVLILTYSNNPPISKIIFLLGWKIIGTEVWSMPAKAALQSTKVASKIWTWTETNFVGSDQKSN